MTARRIGGTCGCVVVASMFWSAIAQAQSNGTTGVAGAPVEIEAVAIGLHGTSDQVPFPGSAVSWTAALPGQQMDFDILMGPLELGRGAVKGAPYSAEAVSEVVQTLADGNRIVRSSTTTIYRDAEGRTRREQGLAIIGPLVASADQTKHVVITDPEKSVTYVLDPTTRTARRMSLPSFGTAGLRLGPGGPALSAAPALPAPPPPVPPASDDVLFFEAAVSAPAGANVRRMITTQRLGGNQAEVSESLGTQTIEGVLAEGTRSTITIAAGQIGNERPIEIVSERWFSPELKTLVLSKQSDPRFGETTYRLSNIVLGNPEASLFEVPADFQIVEPGGPGDVIFRRRVQ